MHLSSIPELVLSSVRPEEEAVIGIIVFSTLKTSQLSVIFRDINFGGREIAD